jgi:uncharacterized protein (TIGR03067 family)
MAIITAAWVGAQQPNKDVELLQGTWRLVGYEALGKKAAGADVDKLAVTLTVQGDRYVDKSENKVAEEGTFKLQPDKNPAQIDIHIESGPDKGKLQLGIYKLAGDTLTFAIAPAGNKTRPGSFSTQLESKYNIQVFKRVK